MVHQSLQLRCHAGILYRNESTEDAVPHALHHRYTYLPEASRPLFLWKPVLCHCDCPHNAGSTRKNQPTEAWYRFPSLQDLRSKDRLSLPSFSWQLTEIRRYQWAYSFLHRAAPAEADLPEAAHSHTYYSERSGSARPSNAVWKIPSHAACSWFSVYQYSLFRDIR